VYVTDILAPVHLFSPYSSDLYTY